MLSEPSTSCPCSQSTSGYCRVCLEEDSIDSLTQPCLCAGTMQYVHPHCLQTWITEKGSKRCEICHQAYKGPYVYPPAHTAAHPDSLALLTQLQMHGVIVRADRSTGTITLQRSGPIQAAEEEPEDAPPSGAAWCFAALMAFMAMLLIRHIFELFSTEQMPQQGSDRPPDGVRGPEASAGMLLLWFTVRFLVILIPMYAVLRVMHTVRDQQMQQEADRDLEQELASVLWSMEAGIAQAPMRSPRTSRAVARATEQAVARSQEQHANLPVIV